MTNKYFKLALIVSLLTGCFQTEKGVLDDVTDSEYAYTICKASCDNQSNNLSDVINKAKIAGISEERIEAAKALGRDKANRELDALRASLDEKCKLENKVACYTGDGCCEDAAIAADAITAAADAAAAATEAASKTDKQSTTPLLEIKIKQGMEYSQARKILIDAGWQTVNAHRTPNGQPVCFLVASSQSWSYQDDVACNYNEIEDCSGTGMGYCKMIFYDGDNSFLSITTSGGRPPYAEIHDWSKEKTFEANVIPLDEISNYEN